MDKYSSKSTYQNILRRCKKTYAEKRHRKQSSDSEHMKQTTLFYYADSILFIKISGCNTGHQSIATRDNKMLNMASNQLAFKIAELPDGRRKLWGSKVKSEQDKSLKETSQCALSKLCRIQSESRQVTSAHARQDR